MTDTSPARSASAVLRKLVMPIYAPVVLSYIGLGMLVPVLPLYLTDAGISLRLVSVVLASLGLGASLGGLPAGALIGRFGERAVVIAAVIVFGGATALLGVTDVALALAALRIASGAANAAVRLSRQTYITRRVGLGHRGRAMSMIGGSFRMSMFVGPLAGGALVDAVGFSSTFAIAGALSLTGLVPLVLDREELPMLPDAGTPARRVGILRAIATHRRLLASAGVVPMLVMAVREGRLVVIPLIGDELGLSPTAVGALVTVGTAADLLLFPVAGWVMDRFGRLVAMVPAFGLIALGLVLLGVADDTATAVIAGAVIGIGNGMSSGTMLTLGSDLAPPDSPAQFLAGMATIQDGGRVLGPLIVGVVGDALGLGAASIALAAVLVAAVAWLVTVVGETGRRPAAAT
ncbi:MAG: MFS transporter [Ilumatobacter sp.]|uniref:MFS transporter n=1 Tax=Ilumatobacter sp. TaxID=1967498 RepID=UPI00260E3764|nr:MFS transporter [Ilumatobacter sp.]MDJ0771365.1 MFS transporter [Ilumatobacter sp.]